MSEILFKNVVVIGLGLLGASFAKALKNNGLSENIFAIDVNEESIKKAIDDNLVVTEKLDNIDLVVIATPLSCYDEAFGEISKLDINKDGLIIDLGSLKAFIKDILPRNIEDNFIPCHPIAGSHLGGYENSDGNLFSKNKFVICTQNNKISKLIAKINAKEILLNDEEHDEIFALTSHLPQFLSFLTKEFSPNNIEDEFFQKAFRLDNSNPDIWDDIFKMNQENIEMCYESFFEVLEENVEMLDNDEFIINKKSQLANFDEKFFEANFAAIFFRYLVVRTYLESFDFSDLDDYCGSGFRDFNVIIDIETHPKINDLIKINKAKILKLFDKISL